MDHLNDALLNEYLDEALDKAARRRTEAHLASCPPCRARLDDLRTVFQDLGLLGEQPPARDLVPGVLARLPGTPLSPGRRIALAIQAGAALGLLAALVRPLAGLPGMKFSLGPALGDALARLSAIQPPALTWPELPMPEVAISLPDLSAWSLPLPAPAAFAMLLAVVVLWGLGNARLLGNGPEVRS